MPNCVLTDIQLQWFMSYLLNSGKVIQNCNFPSPFGCYSRKKKMKLEGMAAQKEITCFLVTDAGKLPPVTGKCWTKSIITAVIRTHTQTQSQHSYYTQIDLSSQSNKRKRSKSALPKGSQLSSQPLDCLHVPSQMLPSPVPSIPIPIPSSVPSPIPSSVLICPHIPILLSLILPNLISSIQCHHHS